MSRLNVVAVGPTGRRVGVVASSFAQFVEKCRTKFGFEKEEKIKVALDDDTEVDEEYFEFLASGTELSIQPTKASKTPKEIHELATFLHKCLQNQPRLHEKITEMLIDTSNSSKALEFFSLLAQVTQKSALISERDGDHEWFKGLDTKFKTKESVMRNSAENRVRSYFEHTKRELLAEDPSEESPVRQAIMYFKELLRECRHNGTYFDRSAKESARLCDSTGLFECEGQYNCHQCTNNHFINPYSCREARIIFSTWNLDHVIEKSRAVLPALKKALEGPKASLVNLQYFFNLLFQHKENSDENSEGNLKLVHIACHVKKPHENKCEVSKIYNKRKTQDIANGHDVVDSSGSKPNLRSSKTSQNRTKRKRPINFEVPRTRRKRQCVNRIEYLKSCKSKINV